ncbi:MAG TPA: tetratricopeptide repeat protein [candidate division Zixibacteria bacterium]|nr:tetratricopeptide repeat protein [candidate division Zixibacteria bacterium]
MTDTVYDQLRRAADAGDHEAVLRETERLLAEDPGSDAAHALRARALLALNRLEEAERHASDAVRLDPEEIRYRELLAEVLAAEGAHRDAATEYGRLARNDPAQPAWTLAEAHQRLDAAQPLASVEAARRAVRLDARNAEAQLALARGLLRTGDARGALQAASVAAELLPGDRRARETLADAHWLADQDAAAWIEFRALANETDGADRERVIGKARQLYLQHAGWLGRLLAGIAPLFRVALLRGWITVR